MTGLRVYTVLDATLPVSPFPGQTRLWIVAARKGEARQMMLDRGIRWQNLTFAGPVPPGPFHNRMRACGLLEGPGVYAYPMPHEPGTPVMRIDSRRSAVPVAAMGDVL